MLRLSSQQHFIFFISSQWDFKFDPYIFHGPLFNHFLRFIISYQNKKGD